MSKLVHIGAGSSQAALHSLLHLIPQSCHIRIHTCFQLTVPPEWSFADRVNADYHIVWIKRGAGCYVVGEEQQEIPFEHGKIILVSPGMRHTAKQDHRDPPSIIPIRFGFYDHQSELARSRNSEPFALAYSPVQTTSYQRLFEQIFECSQASNQEANSTLSGLLASEILFKLYLEQSSSSAEQTTDSRIERVKQYIDEHPASRNTPEQLAEQAGLSEKYVRTRFTQQYGLTPKEYQIKARMDYARFLLMENGQSVKEAAQTLGYPDAYAFSKQFKQHTGESPSRFKARR